MTHDPILSRVSVARRAGMLTPGFAAVREAITKKQAKLVLIAADISAKSEKEIRFTAGGKIPVIRIEHTIFEITSAIGIKAGIISINDQGFASAIIKHLPHKEEMAYDD